LVVTCVDGTRPSLLVIAIIIVNNLYKVKLGWFLT
jgi:hypothetical protein